jgi:hypothetical protein
VNCPVFLSVPRKSSAAIWWPGVGFNRPQKGLADKAPLEYADTEPGAQEIEALLDRIEEGVKNPGNPRAAAVSSPVRPQLHSGGYVAGAAVPGIPMTGAIHHEWKLMTQMLAGWPFINNDFFRF